MKKKKKSVDFPIFIHKYFIYLNVDCAFSVYEKDEYNIQLILNT